MKSIAQKGKVVELKELEAQEDFREVLKAFDELAARKGQLAIINTLKIFADIVGASKDLDGLTLRLLKMRYKISDKTMAEFLGVEPYMFSKIQAENYPASSAVAQKIFEKFKLKLSRYGQVIPKETPYEGLLPAIDFSKLQKDENEEGDD